ncbi:MAG: adk, adenylate kinase, adenylate kinase [Candidatus Adlerbacteria bacterium]|nr:adk, adenylate kinase, adenylate kinase [Candidatus Adlerbacteria bacterium]
MVEQITTIFLGPQGCGKGTHIEKLAAFLQEKDPSRKVATFGMGNSLRMFADQTGFTQEKVRGSLLRGELQPLFLVSSMLADFFIKECSDSEHIIVDGFPREEQQIPVFDSAVQFYGRQNPTLVYITISDEVALERLLKRGRSDDTEDKIKKRLQWTREQMQGILDWFKAHPEYRVLEINGEQSIEAVHQDILKAMQLA